MRKITLFIMTLMMAGSLFAYEPKKECAKVKRNGDVKYYEKTEPYKSLIWDKDYEDHVGWCIRKDYTIEQLVDYEYSILESSRKRYYFGMEEATNPEPTDFEIAMTKLLNKMNGTVISPEEYARSNLLKYAKDEMTWAVTCLVFVTEENYLTLTKEEIV